MRAKPIPNEAMGAALLKAVTGKTFHAVRSKPAPPTADDLAESMRLLCIDEQGIGERVYVAVERIARTERRPARREEIRIAGATHSTLDHALRSLVDARKIFRVSKGRYVPNVAPPRPR